MCVKCEQSNMLLCCISKIFANSNSSKPKSHFVCLHEKWVERQNVNLIEKLHMCTVQHKRYNVQHRTYKRQTKKKRRSGVKRKYWKTFEKWILKLVKFRNSMWMHLALARFIHVYVCVLWCIYRKKHNSWLIHYNNHKTLTVNQYSNPIPTMHASKLNQTEHKIILL